MLFAIYLSNLAVQYLKYPSQMDPFHYHSPLITAYKIDVSKFRFLSALKNDIFTQNRRRFSLFWVKMSFLRAERNLKNSPKFKKKVTFFFYYWTSIGNFIIYTQFYLHPVLSTHNFCHFIDYLFRKKPKVKKARSASAKIERALDSLSF